MKITIKKVKNNGNIQEREKKRNKNKNQNNLTNSQIQILKSNNEDEVYAKTIQATNKVYYAINIVILNHKQVDENTKIIMFKTTYHPILVHASKTRITQIFKS